MENFIVNWEWVKVNYCGEANFTIPDGASAIGTNAFRGCRDLTSVHIPNGVTRIEKGAFEECENLTSVNIPKGVKEIGKETFWGCLNLISINIPNSVTKIGEKAFLGCKSLTSIDIPNSVTKIGKCAFCGCESLVSVNIPNSITKIEREAFYKCQSLESIEIPNSVTFIGKDAFWGCKNLTSVHIPDSVTEIGEGAFDNCESLGFIEFPDGVTIKQATSKQANPKRKAKSGVKWYLLQYSDNWADEFNVEGSVLVDEEGFAMLNELKERFETQEEEKSGCCIGLGSNQFIEYESVSELIDHIECIELNKAEREAVQKLGFDSYGFTNFHDTLLEIWENANDSE